MNIKTFSWAKLLIGASAAMPALALALTVGKPAPDFTVTDTHGEEVSLSDFVGKTVVLEWTNHKCPFVVKHYSAGNMQAQQRKAAELDIVWLSIISSAPDKQGHVSAEKANEIATQNDASPHRILLDESGDIGRAYKAKTTPHMYVIGDDGTLLYQGAIDSNDSADRDDIPESEQYILSAFDALGEGEEIATNTTAPYGCSIKY
ncbi:MAG: redoxin domain-containing protein [Gammaproteobacteria bacterium]|nr:redoxin domain-containing protein [Gammaproteobacteria bacterium]